MLKARIRLLLLLTPIFGLWWWLCSHAPISPWAGLGTHANPKRLSLSHHREQFEDYTVFDIDNKTVERVGRRYVPRNSQTSHIISVVHSNQQQQTIRIEFYSHVSRRVVRSIELSLSSDDSVRVVGERYLITDSADEIRWLDLNTTDATAETWNSFQVSRGEQSWLWSHPTQPVFRRTAFKSTTPGSTQSPQSYTELFRFDENGQLSQLSSWLNSHSGYEGLRNAWFQDEVIASVDASSGSIELRALEDGTLVNVLELGAPIDLSRQKFCLTDGELFVEDSGRYRYYSLKSERWLIPPFDSEDGWTHAALTLSTDSRIAVWQDRANNVVVLTDPATDKQICRIREPGERVEFLAPKNLVSIDSWFMLTIREHNTETGETILVWRPFMLILPALVVALLSSSLWIFAWLRLQHSAKWAWVDLQVLLLLLMILIVFRLRSIGDLSDINRLPYQHATYLSAGFLFSGWAWLALGKGSVLSRLSQLVLTYTIVFFGLTLTLVQQPHLAWTGLASVTVPSLIVLPLVLALRFRRWNWLHTKLRYDIHSFSKSETITLRQLMGLTAVIALMTLAFRPIIPGLAGLLQLKLSIVDTFTMTLVGITALLLAVSTHSSLRKLGIAVVVGTVGLFIADTLSLAAYTGWSRPLGWIHYENSLRQSFGFFATVYLASYKAFMPSQID